MAERALPPPPRMVSRLLRDLREVAENPLANVAAAPLEDNLLEWHFNLRSSEGSLKGLVLHGSMVFPPTYPNDPPEVALFTSITHPNVFQGGGWLGGTAGTFTLCLDMLRSGSYRGMVEDGSEATGWSSAYSAYSVLVQLQAFLLDDKYRLHYWEGSDQWVTSSDARSIQTARSFRCRRCGHGIGTQTVWPAFPSAERLAQQTKSAGITAELTESMGLFNRLPYDVIIGILSGLEPSALARLSATCRAMREFCSDGFLWRTVFHRSHPFSELCVENMSDWKHAYLVETEHAAREFVCFHSHVTFEEDVLGVPLSFSTSPRTGAVDYLYTTMDLLSREAFEKDGVRLSVWKEKFTHWLPLYITESHFQRALPYIRTTLSQLSGGGGTRFHPFMALDTIPKLMNTMVVLVGDKGVHASDKAIDGYCALHRLLLALAEVYPCITTEVERRLRAFASSERNRTKECVPSLGDLAPLMALTRAPDLCWEKIGGLLVRETLDRNVLWNIKAFPELAKQDVPLFKRLNLTLQASRVSQRLLMFHATFLRHLVTPFSSLDDMRQSYDAYYGRPSQRVRAALTSDVRGVLEVNTWPGFFKVIGEQCPTPSGVCSMLTQAVHQSLVKGYHSASMQFGTQGARNGARSFLRST
eukprot:m51a1_g2272 hypothetical protein (642) ;mRNA; f:358400-361040